MNDRAWHFDEFRARLRARGITVWGAAVDTLENTSRFADGQVVGPMTVLHLFDTPLRVTRPYEAYMACLTVPRAVVATASDRSELLDFRTPRAHMLTTIERAYPGIARAHVHVWTLRGASRAARLGELWAEWAALGVHLVEDGWRAPSGLPVFVDSGTYAPTFLVGAWRDAADATHVFLCDGYAASAEAVAAASLAEVLDVDATMAPLSATFDQPIAREDRLMRLAPAGPGFAAAVAVRALAYDRDMGNGWALGGGTELLLCTDLRVVARSAMLGLPEITLGLFPGAGGSQRLMRQVSPCKARELMFLGERITAEEAERIGLAELAAEAARLQGGGRTVVHVARGGRLIGLIAIADAAASILLRSSGSL